MADSDSKRHTETRIEENEKSLKYLDFVQVAAIYVIECAKENSGPLKPGVETVEANVKTVIGPVYEKFHDVPIELLNFVDRKVDESLRELERQAPSLLKQASCQARAVASEVRRSGVLDTAKYITNSVCYKYEPVAEQYAVSAWRSLNRLPLFPQVAEIVVPTAAYWSEKYNQVVRYTEEGGYAVATYLPLIPLERIGKMFDESENVATVSSNGEAVAAR